MAALLIARAEVLDVSDNFFSGELPESVFSLPALGTSERIAACLQHLTHDVFAESLRFDLNEFTGFLPASINAPALGEWQCDLSLALDFLLTVCHRGPCRGCKFPRRSHPVGDWAPDQLE